MNQKLLAEGKRLDAKEGATKWEWGDWALEVAPNGSDHGGDRKSKSKPMIVGLEKKLQDALNEAGVENMTLPSLVKCREVAAAWPPDQRFDEKRVGKKAAASFEVHRALMAKDRRHHMRNGLTLTKARKLAGISVVAREMEISPERVAKQPIRAQVEIIRAVSDEALTQAAAEDPGTHARIARASTDAHERRRRQLPPSAEPFQPIMGIQAELTHARQDLRHAQHRLASVDLTDEHRTILLEHIDEIETALGWLRTYVEGKASLSDAEIQRLLTEIEGR